MKSLLFVFSLGLAVLITASTLRAQELDKLGAIPVNPLDPAEHAYWKKTSGEWDFDASSLTGIGSSRIDYTRQFLTPVRITFDIEVIDGVRPRVFFGEYKLAHEGFDGRHFGIYPAQDKSKRFRYKTGRKFPVQIEITRKRIEVRMDGHLLDSRDIGMDLVPLIGFSSGDDYSKGTTRFYNIQVVGVPSTGQ